MKTLYHGSQIAIKSPTYGKGNPHNDYGIGFYCTEDMELAKEWACIDSSGGFANIYTIEEDKMRILNLSDQKYTILNWLSLLVNNRTFRIGSQLGAQAKEYLLTYFLLDVNGYDAVIGYRADDSYFSFALDFLNNVISLQQLERAMYLGKLGEQFVLRSKAAFTLLRFVEAVPADGERYYELRKTRDSQAREQYLHNERKVVTVNDDLYMIDILRQEMKADDLRLS
jgi:hypothetical protein